MFSAFSSFAILLMAGKGARYSQETPKQYTLYEGKPLFMHAYEQMAKSPNIDAILCVIGKNEEALARDFIKDLPYAKPTFFIEGGATRVLSVENALSHLQEGGVTPDSLILIHDAARPHLEESYIEEGLAKAKEHEAAVTCYPSSDSVALGDGEKLTSYLDRREVYIIATPQCFLFSTIKEAFARRNPAKEYTDDASIVLETMGIKPAIVMSKRDNLKVTFPDDAR